MDNTAEQNGAQQPTKTQASFEIHPLRDMLAGEVHARPFRPVETPRVLHHMAFLSDVDAAEELEALARFCTAHGALPPGPGARHHVVTLGGAELRWERHTEFTTMTLAVAPPPNDAFAAPNIASLSAFLPKPPGPLIAATRLALVPMEDDLPDLGMFDASSLCVARADSGGAVVATDFRPDPSGFTRMLVANARLTPARAGALVQRLLEIETYRTLAILGLPEAQRIRPIVDRIESELAALTLRMKDEVGLQLSRELLEKLVGLAAEVESEAAGATYRFGATRAYWELVTQRFVSIREERIPGYGSIEGFLSRRMKPALRTCDSVERRLTDLSQKLARTSNLLRTRVDIELESQNRDLLQSMNRRARLQLRLQRTVEGLSVAAVSYYIVGLIGYLAKGGEKVLGIAFDPSLATAAAVPVAVLLVWLLVRRIRGGHTDE
ncbi:DUF3422 family protein [Microbaculum marinisediminis]|uniref:DUF3422 domain-containing protein n=1 Tax=Microbaculum marinisediminis TaxID=2931392 RepID=A0AAW5QT99_9HYPH|nr:DUF3422 domain-containing protein [Microbaculum sp. A6E488]MCT8970432.1 DUF3422 domain-containing protein [Microbaculum sp. A6E488]